MSTSLRHLLSGGRRHSPDVPLQLTIGMCTPHTEGGNSHWILMLAERDAEYATWYHSKGGPSLGKPWQVVIERGLLNTYHVETRHTVAEIPSRHRGAVSAAARKTPGGFCQGWVRRVVGELERQGVVPEGKQRIIAELMEEDLYAHVTPLRKEQVQQPSHGKKKSASSRKTSWLGCFCF